MCFTQGTFLTGASDVYLGDLDIGPGRGAGFSIEAPTGNRFIIRSRIFTDRETEALSPL